MQHKVIEYRTKAFYSSCELVGKEQSRLAHTFFLKEDNAANPVLCHLERDSANGRGEGYIEGFSAIAEDINHQGLGLGFIKIIITGLSRTSVDDGKSSDVMATDKRDSSGKENNAATIDFYSLKRGNFRTEEQIIMTEVSVTQFPSRLRVGPGELLPSGSLRAFLRVGSATTTVESASDSRIAWFHILKRSVKFLPLPYATTNLDGVGMAVFSSSGCIASSNLTATNECHTGDYELPLIDFLAEELDSLYDLSNAWSFSCAVANNVTYHDPEYVSTVNPDESSASNTDNKLALGILADRNTSTELWECCLDQKKVTFYPLAWQ
ncbi:hypothetical protein DFH27DRAFT_651991 [Peziza echinospora]|nr:hypothetical protein DFH27DRAFT_651991 [Peziza echinospora]